MTGRTHDTAAITALAIAIILFPLPANITLATALIALLANQIGGIAPDIDQPTAPFWRNLPIFRIFGQFSGRLLGGHRFLTHSLLGVALLSYAAHWLLIFLGPIMPTVNTQLVWWAFVVGLLSHLVMDTFTKEGVPWLLPIPFKFGLPPIKSLRLTTGKWIETTIVFPLLIVLNIIICYVYYEEIAAFVRGHVQP